jgi:hypothetical protein
MSAVCEPAVFKLLVVTQGQWGERIADNLDFYHPTGWVVSRWAAPRALPLLIDDGLDYLPPKLPPADVILAVGDTVAVPQLAPDIARLTGARAVIVPIDRNESLPPGLVKQLRGWLADIQVAAVFPKPFCSLTETTYNEPPLTVTYDNPLIRQFAQHFGRPTFSLAVENKSITHAAALRDSACGCGRYVAEGLIGLHVEEAEYEAGMLHHHYPCLASMNQDPDYKDTLMHVSGHLVRQAVKRELAAELPPPAYLRPAGRVEETNV